MKTVKEKWDKLRCWANHDWCISEHIRETGVEDTYVYERECVRDNCGRKQRISICVVGDQKIHYLEKEWTEKKK